LNFKDPLIKEKLASFTNRLAKKTQQREKDQAVTQNILKSSIGPQFQEIMVVTECKKVEARKTKASLEKQMETRTQKK
jgi:hypothetical protein